MCRRGQAQALKAHDVPISRAASTGHALLTAAVLCGLVHGPAHAASPATPIAYPEKPVRVVVGFPAGGAADIFARIIGQKMSQAWGVPVVIDDRPGAGSTIASELVANATPDGYTLLAVSASYAVSAGLYAKRIKYHPIDSFTPLGLFATNPNILVTHPSANVKTVKELIAAARAAPGKFTMGSGGPGSITDLSGELLAYMAGIRFTAVPYKGGGPTVTALLAGEIHVTVASIPAALPGIKAGRVLALGVTSAKRLPAMPEVPAIAESLPGYEALNWYGMLGPAGMAAPVTAKIDTQIRATLRMPDVIDAIARQTAEPAAMPPVEFRQFLQNEIAKWTKVIQAAGLKG